MPSMSMVVGNVFPFLGLIYTMKVSYNLSYVRMEVFSFFIRGRQSLRSSMQSPCGVSRGVVSSLRRDDRQSGSIKDRD